MAGMHEDDSPDLREVARILNEVLGVHQLHHLLLSLLGCNIPLIDPIVALLAFLIFSLVFFVPFNFRSLMFL